MNFELARRGPAFLNLEAAGAVDWERWEHAAQWLEQHLPDLPRKAERIHWLTVPIFLWLLRMVASSEQRPLMVGLSAPQGAGKTTLTKHLVELFEAQGIRALALSIDDFYLPHAQQLELAANYPDNPYLKYRGYPGTHDVPLGLHTLQALRDGVDVELPSYDKSAFDGRGDRSQNKHHVEGRFDVVLLEGWMLGFKPVPVNDAAMEVINDKLVSYQAWHALLEVMVCLTADDPLYVLRWRAEAEEAARKGGQPALDAAAIDDYVRRFLPAYQHYAATVTGEPSKWLKLVLDRDRLPSVNFSAFHVKLR